MPEKKQNLSRYEIIGYILITAGAIVLIWGTIKFNLVHELYAETGEREGGTFGEYGEFIGGIVGSLWALAGVFLFFATLTYQKREFELQRFELHKTQKIFQQQNFSTLYISFINKHNDIIDSLTAYDINKSERRGTNFFVFFQEKVQSSFIQKVRDLQPQDRTEEALLSIFRDYFTYHFSFYQNSLDPYLKNLSVLFKLIQRYRSETHDKGEYYSFITKASFTQSELFLIYHVAQFNLLKEFNAFDDAFDVFEDLVEEYKVDTIIKKEQHTA
ncbi:putative phage abortive infection protein [Pontibacter pamirensis]|uniref:putative phage abortive infection protein n=1 Tax=Pontibacter pamirensis TaxID=2562824 RepID=UPI00138A43B6|nr:putative phage abortive infection protein [Pontibacter pamirensis]